MARPTKAIAEFKKALETMSFKDKLRLWLNLHYGGEEAIDEKIRLIEKSLSPQELKELNKKYRNIFHTIITLTDRVRNSRNLLIYYSLYIGAISREISIYNKFIWRLNPIVNKVAERAKEEDLKKVAYNPLCNDFTHILSDLRGLSRCSTDIITISYSKEKEQLELNEQKAEESISRAIGAFNDEMRVAKGLSVAIREFYKMVGADEIIPDEILDIEKDENGEYSEIDPTYSMLKYKELQKAARASRLNDYDNWQLEKLKEHKAKNILMLSLADAEPDPELIGLNNIFYSRWKSIS